MIHSSKASAVVWGEHSGREGKGRQWNTADPWYLHGTGICGYQNLKIRQVPCTKRCRVCGQATAGCAYTCHFIRSFTWIQRKCLARGKVEFCFLEPPGILERYVYSITDATPCDIKGLRYSTTEMLSIGGMFSFLRLMVQSLLLAAWYQTSCAFLPRLLEHRLPLSRGHCICSFPSPSYLPTRCGFLLRSALSFTLPPSLLGQSEGPLPCSDGSLSRAWFRLECTLSEMAASFHFMCQWPRHWFSESSPTVPGPAASAQLGTPPRLVESETQG